MKEYYDEAKVLAQALEHGLEEVRQDVSSLVVAEVQRAGLSPEEARRLIRGVVEEEMDRRAARPGSSGWLLGAVSGFVAGAVAAVVALLLSGAIPL